VEAQNHRQKLSMTRFGFKVEMVVRVVEDPDCCFGATVRLEVENFGMESRLGPEPSQHVRKNLKTLSRFLSVRLYLFSE